MSNTTDSFSEPSLLTQAKERLHAFFRQPVIKKSVDILVPGILAAVLFPAFGPSAAAPTAAIAIQNGLKLLGISLSSETTKKLIKPLEGKGIDESDLLDVLEEVLPTDKQVNEETAKALVIITPMVKEAALTNPKLDMTWLGESLERSLVQQGEIMAQIAPKVRELVHKDENEQAIAIEHLLLNWSRISVEVTADHNSRVSNIESKARATGGAIGHRIAADNESTVEGIKADSEIL